MYYGTTDENAQRPNTLRVLYPAALFFTLFCYRVTGAPSALDVFLSLCFHSALYTQNCQPLTQHACTPTCIYACTHVHIGMHVHVCLHTH